MRVLWVTPYWPSPQRGAGDVLLFELLRLTATQHSIHLIIGGPKRSTEGDALETLNVTYETVDDWTSKPGRGPLGTAFRLAARDAGIALFQPHRTEALRRAVQRFGASEKPDLVQVTHGELAPILASCPSPSALLLFDVYWRQMRQEAIHSRRLRGRVAYSFAQRKLARWESRWYRLADAIACNSPVDAAELAALIGCPIDVIKNAVNAEYYEVPSGVRSRDLVTFVAHLGYRPNVDAVEWLTQAIWPRVVKARPRARLRIVGLDPTPQVYDAAERVGAAVHGDVADVRPFYWDTAVAVAPIRLGSGIRNKVLHAMASCAPVVATPTAVEGLDVVHGEHLLLAEDADSFAEAIVDVLTDPPAAEMRATRARSFVEAFRAEAVASSLDDWWRRIVERSAFAEPR